MATRADVIEHLLQQTSSAGSVAAKKMFGEFGFYCDGILVGVICDDRLFLKPTKAGREIIGDPIEAAPYPGARPSFLIEEERWDDKPWLSRLVRATADELPAPKAKTRKR